MNQTYLTLNNGLNLSQFGLGVYLIPDGKETIDDAEEMINLSNAYQQSAISLTASTVPTDRINVYVSAGVYKKHRFKDEKTGNEKVKYYRIPIEWNNNNNPVDLPSADNKTTKKEIFIKNKEN